MFGFRRRRSPGVFIVVRLVLATVEMTTVHAGSLATAGSLDTVVVHYAETIGELAEQDRGPSLTIHQDGTFEAHYPAYMRRAGNYRGRLDAQTLDALLRRIVERGVLDFDAAAVRAERRDAAMARALAPFRPGADAPLFEASDPSITSITVRRDGVERTVTWAGLRADVARHPEITALRALRDTEVELRDLMERSDLRRVP